MRKPWSISTTVRNPERLREFLRVLKKLEGEDFNKDTQIKYQILLIKEKLYKPNNIPREYLHYYEDPELEIPYEVAEKIFWIQKYEDPSMRGRQSVNPLNKLGFSIAREGLGSIKITDLGNIFLSGEYDISFVFFKSLLKLQFPNPWSKDFSARDGFNIMPFVATLHLIYLLNQKTHQKGLSKTEFCLFIPTLINVRDIEKYVALILKFRRKNKKERETFAKKFLKEFYGISNLPIKKINNLWDYGDNIMRYFRLTKYFKLTTDPLGCHWRIDLEPPRLTEIEQLLKMYKGNALHFETLDDYLKYLIDITQPRLPWEEKENLREIAAGLRKIITSFVKQENIQLKVDEINLLKTDIKSLERIQLEEHIENLRKLNLKLKLDIKKKQLVGNIRKVREIINILRKPKEIRKFEPEQFEKLITEALKILNDELLIQPNYPMDDEGEPISHAPSNKPDIECYYKRFKAICEVTLNTSNLQWVQEGQPVMRHLREFERKHGFKNVFCIFIAPRIHKDTYSQFWISVKYEYDGKAQRIIPLSTDQFALILEKLCYLVEKGEKFSHTELYKLYNLIIEKTRNLQSYSEWAEFIPKLLTEWKQKT